jgi:hypothetical protein
MTDYTERGAAPVEDAAVDDPPTVDEVLERQREEFPEQAATSTMQPDARDTGSSGPSPEKPVDEWVTGDEPMTGPQRSYLETLAREAGSEVPDQLTKAQASEMIEQLQRSTGRGDAVSTGGAHGDAEQRSLIEEVAEDGIA